MSLKIMRICIIKLGADGDVIRTLPVIKAIKEANEIAKITLITRGDVASLMESPFIDNILTFYEKLGKTSEMIKDMIDIFFITIRMKINLDKSMILFVTALIYNI